MVYKDLSVFLLLLCVCADVLRCQALNPLSVYRKALSDGCQFVNPIDLQPYMRSIKVLQ